MWLYVPSHYSAGSGLSTSQSRSLSRRLARSCTWKGKSKQPQFWRRVLNQGGWMTLLSGATSAPSTLDDSAIRWISSTVGCPASPTPLPASGSATKTSGRSRRSSSGSWPSVDPPWSSSRTSQLSLPMDGFDLSERNYADWVTRSKIRSSLARETLARLICVSEFSSWRTPNVPNGGRSCEANLTGVGLGGEKRQVELAMQAAHWQTPKSPDGGNTSRSGDRKDEPLLEGQASMWPTPRTITGGAESRERKQKLGRTESGGGDLQAATKNWPTPTAKDMDSSGVKENFTKDSGRHDGTTLTDAIRTWPTLAATDYKGGTIDSQRGRRLTGFEMEDRGRWGENQYPTPSATPYGSAQNEGGVEHDRPSRGTPSLTQWAASSPQALEISTSGEESSSGPPTSRRRLNPAFVAWLMGLPWWWTRLELINCDPAAMQSFHCKLRGRLLSFFGG